MDQNKHKSMSENFLFRRIFVTLLVALIFWSVLTSIAYSQIARPAFQRMKSEDLFDQAQLISYLLSENDNVVDDNIIRVLSLSIRFYETGTYITDANGQILAYNYPENIPDNLLDNINNDFNEMLRKVITTNERTSKTLHLEVIDQDLLMVAVPILDNSQREGNLVGTVMMFQTMQELKASYNSLNIALLISAIVVGLIVVIPVLFFASRMVKPLTEMRNAASAMIAGDFSHRLKTKEENNEISYLVNAFNHLSSELENNINKLTKEKNQLQLIIDGIAEGIVAVDENGNVTQFNDIIWQLFHMNSKLYSADELLRIADIDSLFDACIQEKEIIIEIKKSGQNKINCIISPLFDSEDILIGAVGLFRDVTETEKLEQTRHEYVSNVSHELRTPITAMRGLLEPLNDGLVKSEENKKRYYAILLRETIRLSHLIDDMLELSRIQTSEKTTNLGPVNLQNDLIDMAIRFEVLADQKGIHFETSNLNIEYPAVWGKADRISQILTIMMENAVKFTEPDGYISMYVIEEADKLSISIQDDGCGIKTEDIPYVFERFYKADKSHNEHGTGLGLSIAKELATQMGHSLSVTSQVNVGSIFTLSMPYAQDVMRSELHLKDVYESDIENE